eukprot:13484958-Ditylum_brightwellii.AAC.1
MLKKPITLQQFPAEEDYWKTGQISAVVYPNFGIWMLKRRFDFIKKHLQLSSYDIFIVEKATDTRDASVAVKNTMH